MNAVVLVSGAPGAGKTTLAAPLATSLQLPLLSKDVIKERLYDSLPVPPTDRFTWSRQIGATSMELLWTLAAYAPAVVLEANFRPKSEYERQRLRDLHRPIVEVYCDCPPELAIDRYARRASSPQHHRGAHPTTSLSRDVLSEFDAPIGFGTVIRVDTAHDVQIEVVVRQVAAALTASCDIPSR